MKVLLFEGGKDILATFGDKLSAKGTKALEKTGVEVHTGSIVTGVDADGVDVKGPDGTVTRYPAKTKIWAAGVSASPLAKMLADATGAELDRAGRIKVQPDCSLPGHPEVFAVGDMMNLNDLPGVAEVALQTGIHAARTIRRRLEGERAAALQVPRPRQHGGDLAAPCRRQLPRHPRHRLPRLGDVDVRPPRVPDRVQEPVQDRDQLDAQLRRLRPHGTCPDGENRAVSMLASTTVDLARAQFATTSIYHFLFVPLTLGLGPIVAVFQTAWHRTKNEQWLKLTHFFGTLFLINFAIGVATGLVQEFQFGMNWSVYSKFVGNVFGAPLAIEGLAAFFLESTFLGLWIFGWNRLSPRAASRDALDRRGRHVAVGVLHPRRQLVHAGPGRLQGRQRGGAADEHLVAARRATGRSTRSSTRSSPGSTCGAAVVFGVCCWHFARGRNVELFRPAAKVALIVLVPVSCVEPLVRQPLRDPRHEAPADEDLRQPRRSGATAQHCAFSLFQIGGFTESDQTPSFSIEIPGHALVPRHRLVQRQGDRA